MNIIEVDTSDRRQVKQFLNLPFRLYTQIPQWVPPLAPEARRIFDRKRHIFYQAGEAAFLLALDEDGKAVGRLAVFTSQKYNEYFKERTASFYLFESEHNQEIANCLFEAAFNWARSRQLNRMVGPRGLTALDGKGLLVHGFEHRPAFGQPYNLPYYGTMLENLGFEWEDEFVSGYLGPKTTFPEKLFKVAEILQKRRGLSVTRFRSRGELRAILPKLKDLYNGSLAGVRGNVPLNDQEIKILADQLLWFADPRLIKIVMKGEQPVGFLFAYPDISSAMQRTKGRIFPFGWIDLLLELRRTKWININGAGMIEGYRGLGGTALLFTEMYKSVAAGNYRHADLVQVSVENENMQREMRNLGIDFYKTHRVYYRAL